MTDNKTSQAVSQLLAHSNPASRLDAHLKAILDKYKRMEEALRFYADMKNFDGYDVIETGQLAEEAISFDPLS